MNEIIKERLMNSIGKRCEVFLTNGFRFFGLIKGCDNDWLELFEFKLNGYKIIRISDISNLDIKGEEK